MALWGNSDAVSTLGTAELRVVSGEIQLVGSATSFGNPGFAKTGDIIELGFPKNSLGVGTYFGSAVITIPTAIYLFVIGETGKGIIMVIVALVVGNIDNLIRAYLIKGKAEVHPLFIVFAILGGISLFGLWGILIGPLVVALAVQQL